MADTKHIIGAILLTIVSAAILYVTLPDNVKIRVDNDKSTFYIYNDSKWLVSGREYNRLFNGTKLLNRDLGKTYINYSFDNDTLQTFITRTTTYQKGPVIIDTYLFDGSTDDKERFPIYHKVEVFNASGLFYRYTVDDLKDTGPKRKLDGEVELSFGFNMKVWLEKGYNWAWVGYPYGSDSLSAQYLIKSDYEVLHFRFFDPDASTNLVAEFTWDADSDADYGSFTAYATVATHVENCFMDGCYYFDGSNDYINYTKDIMSTANASVSFWSNASGTTNTGYMFADANDAGNIFVRRGSTNPNNTDGSTGDVGWGSNAFESDRNAWVHYVITTNSDGNFYVYQNGNLEFSDDGSNFAGLTTHAMFGNRQALDRDYLGNIDEVTFWNNTLSEYDVKKLHYDYLQGYRPTAPQTIPWHDWYVSWSDGSDTYAGNSSEPVKTIEGANDLPLLPGDTLHFKRGDSWKFPEDEYLDVTNGNSTANVTYSDYGTGDNPIWFGSYNASSTGNWSDQGGNKWRWVGTSDVDIGNIIFNNNASIGRKYNTSAELTAQGHFAYNRTADTVDLYSTSNPGSVYTNIELAPNEHIVTWNSKHDVVFENITVKYGGAHGFGGSSTYDITVRNCSFEWIGGAYNFDTGSTIRYGNCVEFWNSAHDNNVIFNNFYQCYDEAITDQGSGDGAQVVYNINLSYNTFRYTHLGIKSYIRDTGSTFKNITISHNTGVDSGYDAWATTQRVTNRSECVGLDWTQATNDNINVIDNLCYLSNNWTFRQNTGTDDATVDYNLYYNPNSGDTLTNYKDTEYTVAEFADYQTDSGNDANSVVDNPDFVDYAGGDFTPSYGSPACTMSSTGSYVGALPCAESTYNSDYLNLGDNTSIVFVDKNNPECSDSYNRTQAMSGLTPYCNIDTALANIALTGDTIYILNGTYTDTSVYSISNKIFTGTTKLTAYPDNQVNITTTLSDYESTPNSKWNNMSNATHPSLYNSSYSTSVGTWYAFYTSNNTLLYTFLSLADLMDTANPEGIYFDNTADYFYLRLNDASANPNNIALSLAKNDGLQINNVNGSEFIISNLTFQRVQKGIYVYGQSENITIINNTFITGHNGVHVKEYPKNTRVQQNTFNQSHANWSWSDMKSSRHEVSGVNAENTLHNVNISNNIISGYFNGIYTYMTSLGKGQNIQVFNNNITFTYDDAIELENYCNGGSYYNNIISNSYKTFSITPASAAQSECFIYNNMMFADTTQWITGGTFFNGDCFHIDENGGLENYSIHDNTCEGRGVWSDTDKVNTQVNVTWYNNLFYSTNDKLLDKSGQANNSVTYDYNLYWRSDAGTIFRYWNNDTSSLEFTTLALALFSSQNPGTWDSHSLNVEPDANTSYYPDENSSLIDAGTNTSLNTDVYGNPIYGTQDIGAVEYQPPYDMDTDSIDDSGVVRVYADSKYRYTTVNTTGNLVDFKAVPALGWGSYAGAVVPQWADIDITASGAAVSSWTVNTIMDIDNVTFSLGSLSATTNYSIYADAVFNQTVQTNSTGWLVFNYSMDDQNVTFTLDEITYELNMSGYSTNIAVELGSVINLSATAPSGDVCIDFNHPEYGVNYSCDTSETSFNANVTYFRTTENNASESAFNLTYTASGAENLSFYIPAHQYDEVINLTMNLTTFQYGTESVNNVLLYINNTLSNNITELGKTEINYFSDESTSLSHYHPSAVVSLVGYFRLPSDLFTVTSATMNITAQTGTVYQENSDTFSLSGGSYDSVGYAYTSYVRDGNPIWQAKYGGSYGGTYNYSYTTLANAGCLYDDTTMYFRIESGRGSWPECHTKVYCKNITTYTLLGTATDSSCSIQPSGGSIGNALNDSNYATGGVWDSYTTPGAHWEGETLSDTRADKFFEEGIYWNYTLPTDVWVEVGTVNGTRDFNYTGAFEGPNVTEDFAASINGYISGGCPNISGDFCYVPIYVYANNATLFNLTAVNISFNYNPNPVQVDVELLESFLGNSSNGTVINVTISSTSNGTIQVDDLQYNYAGGNKTYTAIAHDPDYTNNVTYNITYYYSRWDYAFPTGVQYIELIPRKPVIQNVTPFGQSNSSPILNFTMLGYGGRNTDFGSYINESYVCVNLTMGTTSNKSEGTIYENSTWYNLSTDVSYLGTVGNWWWADYNCNYSTWKVWTPYVYYRGCCSNCDICSEELT